MCCPVGVLVNFKQGYDLQSGIFTEHKVHNLLPFFYNLLVFFFFFNNKY